MPEFRIQGDVGPETGNIRFSGAIVVEGSVLSGFIMRCGGDMTVRAASKTGDYRVRGRSDRGRRVDRGENRLHGQETVRVGMSGLQHSRSGSVIVKSYISIPGFLREELSVDGQYVTGDERGAIVAVRWER